MLSKVLYHVTEFDRLYDIITTDTFRFTFMHAAEYGHSDSTDVSVSPVAKLQATKAAQLWDKGYTYFGSFARSVASAYIISSLHIGENSGKCIIEVDGEKLQNAGIASPYSYKTEPARKHSEMEDRLYSKQRTLSEFHKYIKAIHIYYPGDRVHSNEDLYVLIQKIRQTMQAVPVYVYSRISDITTFNRLRRITAEDWLDAHKDEIHDDYDDEFFNDAKDTTEKAVVDVEGRSTALLNYLDAYKERRTNKGKETSDKSTTAQKMYHTAREAESALKHHIRQTTADSPEYKRAVEELQRLQQQVINLLRKNSVTPMLQSMLWLISPELYSNFSDTSHPFFAESVKKKVSNLLCERLTNDEYTEVRALITYIDIAFSAKNIQPTQHMHDFFEGIGGLRGASVLMAQYYNKYDAQQHSIIGPSLRTLAKKLDIFDPHDWKDWKEALSPRLWLVMHA